MSTTFTAIAPEITPVATTTVTLLQYVAPADSDAWVLFQCACASIAGTDHQPVFEVLNQTSAGTSSSLAALASDAMRSGGGVFSADPRDETTFKGTMLYGFSGVEPTDTNTLLYDRKPCNVQLSVTMRWVKCKAGQRYGFRVKPGAEAMLMYPTATILEA